MTARKPNVIAWNHYPLCKFISVHIKYNFSHNLPKSIFFIFKLRVATTWPNHAIWAHPWQTGRERERVSYLICTLLNKATCHVIHYVLVLDSSRNSGASAMILMLALIPNHLCWNFKPNPFLEILYPNLCCVQIHHHYYVSWD